MLSGAAVRRPALALAHVLASLLGQNLR